MKKKLLIVLGAGSSSAVGLPSVKCLNRLIERWGTEWARQHGTTDHYEELRKSAKTYYERGLTQFHPPLNFEKVLGDMIAMAHWLEPPPWGNTLRQAACGARLPDLQFKYHQEQENEGAQALLVTSLLSDECDIPGGEFESIGDPSVAADPLPEDEPAVDNGECGERGKYGAQIELMDEYSLLLERLAQYMRAESQRFNLAIPSEDGKYKELLRGLRENFDIGVYNLNYDTAALNALPGAYTGFSENGTFEPRVVHERKDWDFVYHFHGSVHHSLNRWYGDQIVWKSSLKGEFFDGPEGTWSDPRSNGIKIPRTTLVAGGFKLDQLLFEPFQSFHGSLIRHVYAADAILIGGYGFGDAHINFALRNRLSLTQDGLRVQDRPPVMVLTLADEMTRPMRRRDDLWARELGVSLCTGTQGHFFMEPGNPSDPIPIELAKRGTFEVDAQHRVAVWYGGFTEAVQRLPNVIQWLDGGFDNALAGSSAQGM